MFKSISHVMCILLPYHIHQLCYMSYNMRCLVQQVVDVVAELYTVGPSPSQHAIH